MSNKYNTWAATPGLVRCCLLQISYSNSQGDHTMYLSNLPYISRATDNPVYQSYDPYIKGGLVVRKSMSEAFTGNSATTITDVDLLANDATLKLIAPDVIVNSIVALVGDPSWPLADYKQFISAAVDSINPNSGKLKIKLVDKTAILKQTPLSQLYTSTDAKDKYQPMAFGDCFNVPLVAIDEANHVYQFNSVPSASVGDVRFNGAIVPPANYTVDLAASTITFSVMPIGNVTADIVGAISNGSACEIIQYIVDNYTTDILATNTTNNLGLSLYISGADSLAAIFDKIAVSTGSHWYYDGVGQLHVKAYQGVSAQSQFILYDADNKYNSRTLVRTIKPIDQLTVIYDINYASGGDIADSVIATDKEQLTNPGQTIVGNQVVAGQSERVDMTTQIQSPTDAQQFINQRLVLNTSKRYVYQTVQLSILPIQLGDQVLLDTATPFGDVGIVTKLNIDYINGTTTMEITL